MTSWNLPVALKLKVPELDLRSLRAQPRPKHCEKCPFKSRTCGSRGPVDARIVIVGESPGTNEIIRGLPFIGPSGELLHQLLSEIGIDPRNCLITNAFKCLPPRSRGEDGKHVKSALVNDATRSCQQSLFAEIAEYPRDLIITMGTPAARALTGIWGFSIMKRRGQVIPSELAAWGILPTFHPAYVLRSPIAMPQIRADLEKAYKFVNGIRFPDPKIEYRELTTTWEIDRFIYEGTRTRFGRPTFIVADIETTGLSRQKDKFRCIGLQFEHTLDAFGKNIVYMVSGNGRGKLVQHLFASMPPWVRWVWHNGKFDTSFLRAKGIPRDQCRVDEDTLLLSYTLDEAGGRHSLEQCIIDHLGLPAYKDMLGEYVGTGKKRKAFGDVPKALLYEYCAKDITFTGLLFQKLRPQINLPEQIVEGGKLDTEKLIDGSGRSHLEAAYTGLLIPAANALATVELNGMPISQEVVSRSEKEFEAKIIPVLRKIRRLVGDPDFNPRSYPQLLDAFRRLYKLKLNSTNEKALKEHEGLPLTALLFEYRGLQKTLGTYIRAFKGYGDRIHTSYLIHGTVTGRLSSTDPNVQNIPKDPIVRQQFVAPRRRRFVAFDYSQAELRSMAWHSRDRLMLDTFMSGRDLHHELAAEVYGTTFTSLPKKIPNPLRAGEMMKNPTYDQYRTFAKRVNFGIPYGIRAPLLASMLTDIAREKNPSAPLVDVSEAQELIEVWFKMFPGAARYLTECRRAPMTGRPLITIYGRQRRFYLVSNGNMHSQSNEAGNFPHQSMCSDFTLDSAIQIDRIAASGGLPGGAKQINIIHDDNMFEIDDNDEAVKELVSIVQPLMEETPRRHGIKEITFVCEASQGYAWNAMQEIHL